MEDAIKLQEQFVQQLIDQGKGVNTLKNYKADINCFYNFLKTRQDKISLSDFSSTKVLEYSNYINEKYNSDNSKRRRLQTLRIFFDFLISKGLYKENPIRKIQNAPKFLDIPRPTPMVDIKKLWWRMEKEYETISEEENNLATLILCRNMLIVQLIYGGALKVSDLERLELEDISIGLKRTRVMIGDGKRNPFTIPLPDIFKKYFKYYRDLLTKEKKRCNIQFENLFFNANPYQILSGGISARGLEITFEEFKKKYGVETTPKALRQSCIFKWLNQKKPEATIKSWMGVAPSYSLRPYRDLLNKNFFEEI